ncbi:putative ribonuclease H protein [Trifolium medium]|uniref:Putative ribonuclease H protein n=1 Tax=Trifolium medium TaxID=97028 RepID=A0A392LX78_9FABA|nr:putative ribonuclease H protein [Trifolium medium]
MHKMKGKKGYFAIKVDLSKAYDKLSWEFVWRIMSEMKLPKVIINVIMHSITSVETNVKWHGAHTDYFRPQRGIRQGDPISPYLFVLCMDKLSHLISRAVNEGQWRTLRAGRNGPMVSHLMFADDLLLFGEATERQMDCLMGILTTFCKMSGQEKSGFRESNYLGKYLGVPLTGKAPRRADFQYLIDQVSAKLSRWKMQQLSFAGSVMLGKSVIEATPIYPMMSICIPKVGWDVVTRPKRFGGLGLRRLDIMNQACLLKLGWKFNPGATDLWCEVLRGKYHCQCIRENMETKVTDSNLWTSLVKLSPKLNDYNFWVVCDGRSIDAWIDVGLHVSDLDVHIPDEIRDVKVSILPPSDMHGEDQQLGAGPGSTKFSVAAMYNILCGFDDAHEDARWRHIWKFHLGGSIKYDDTNNYSPWRKYMRLRVAINTQEHLKTEWSFDCEQGAEVKKHESGYAEAEKKWRNFIRAENGYLGGGAASKKGIT